jgi:hypothetical protein
MHMPWDPWGANEGYDYKSFLVRGRFVFNYPIGDG